MGGRTVHVVEIKTKGHAVINDSLKVICGRNVVKRKLNRAHRGGRNGKQAVFFFPVLRCNDQDLGPTKLCQRKAAESVSLFQCRCWQPDAAQELTGCKDISV